MRIPCRPIWPHALALAAATFACLASTSPAQELTPTMRNLASFANDDGTIPDGKDDANDDSSALRKALAVGPGTVCIPPGLYRFAEVAIPSGVALVGSGAGTVVRSNGGKSIFVQQSATAWAVRDMVLDGEAAGDWHQRQDAGQSGVVADGCWGYDIVGVTLRNFSGAGVQVSHTNLGESGHAQGGNLERVTALGCFAGVRLDVRAEYLNASELSCFRNLVGCIIHAGNAKVVASNFSENVDGILIEDKDNGSHGAISSCLVNHNERYALLARNAAYGMAVDDCCFFYGAILIENSAGISITSGIIGCHITTDGPAANRIAGNYVIPESWEFKFCPATIAEGNFTAIGLWDKNTR
jgi:hypothetical protein